MLLTNLVMLHQELQKGFLEIEAYLLEQESNAEISLLYKLMKKIFR